MIDYNNFDEYMSAAWEEFLLPQLKNFKDVEVDLSENMPDKMSLLKQAFLQGGFPETIEYFAEDYENLYQILVWLETHTQGKYTYSYIYKATSKDTCLFAFERKDDKALFSLKWI